MLKKFALACLLGLAMDQVSAQATEEDENLSTPDDWTYNYNGHRWRSWPAEMKHWRLMEEVFADDETRDYDYNLDHLFRDQDMNRTTCNIEDEIVDRPKMLHQTGVVASCEWIPYPEAHNYTGMFESGAKFGIMRLSDSSFLVDGRAEVNPSVALKFLRDGVESQNLLFMIDFNNQEGTNFFPRDADGEFKPFTTHPTPFKEEDECSRKTIVRKMKQGSFLPFSIGTGEFAAAKECGDEVEEGEEVFPWELMLVPNEKAIKEHRGEEDPLDYLYDTPASGDQALFYIMARQLPFATPVAIGELRSTSDMVRSKFGDERLFFRHEPFNRDIVRLRNQGRDRMARWWTNAERRSTPYELGNEWDNELTASLPADNDEAMEIIENGILGEFGPDMTCPFSWLLQ